MEIASICNILLVRELQFIEEWDDVKRSSWVKIDGDRSSFHNNEVALGRMDGCEYDSTISVGVRASVAGGGEPGDTDHRMISIMLFVELISRPIPVDDRDDDCVLDFHQ